MSYFFIYLVFLKVIKLKITSVLLGQMVWRYNAHHAEFNTHNIDEVVLEEIKDELVKLDTRIGLHTNR